MEQENPWGQLTIIDLHECDEQLVRNGEKLKEFCSALCKTIHMKVFGDVIVQRFGSGDLKGYSAMAFIETSTITVHLDEAGRRAFIDIFSCKAFDTKTACEFCKDFYNAHNAQQTTTTRG